MKKKRRRIDKKRRKEIKSRRTNEKIQKFFNRLYLENGIDKNNKKIEK